MQSLFTCNTNSITSSSGNNNYNNIPKSTTDAIPLFPFEHKNEATLRGQDVVVDLLEMLHCCCLVEAIYLHTKSVEWKVMANKKDGYRYFNKLVYFSLDLIT